MGWEIRFLFLKKKEEEILWTNVVGKVSVKKVSSIYYIFKEAGTTQRGLGEVKAAKVWLKS